MLSFVKNNFVVIISAIVTARLVISQPMIELKVILSTYKSLQCNGNKTFDTKDILKLIFS